MERWRKIKRDTETRRQGENQEEVERQSDRREGGQGWRKIKRDTERGRQGERRKEGERQEDKEREEERLGDRERGRRLGNIDKEKKR